MTPLPLFQADFRRLYNHMNFNITHSLFPKIHVFTPKSQATVAAVVFFGFLATGILESAAQDEKGAGKRVEPEKMTFVVDLSDAKIRSEIEALGGQITKDGPEAAAAFQFSAPKGTLGMVLKVPIDVVPLRGAKVALTGFVRGDGIMSLDAAVPLISYEGIKFELFVNSPTKGKENCDAINLHGTFPWRSTGRVVCIPDDASEVSINLGIQNASGTARFSGVKLSILQPKPKRPSLPDKQASNQVTRFRGVMTPHVFREKDFADMAALKINFIRWHMWKSPEDQRTYEDWLAFKLDELARVLDEAAKYNIKVAINLQSSPGERIPDGTMRMVLEKKYQDQFLSIWLDIARRFKGHSAVWGYDLVNEPVQAIPSPDGLKDWLGLQVEVGKAIRRIDPTTPIIIETDQWDTTETFKWLQPVDIPNVIYSVHMYWPGEYTHQGVWTDQGVAKDKCFDPVLSYPGTYAGSPLDKEALRRDLAPVREFQLAYGVPIFVGEFSAVRWAPGADRYIDDCIALFEEYGWNWTYHAFREWDGWSAEHADLPRDRTNHPLATTPTARMKVLEKWFNRNAEQTQQESSKRDPSHH